ncbi:aldehyde dehydrogenase family protein [Halegenticoccus tardaugens]|uniref:aldehyde dehydrogenase family protein n=1 Tax=Halegenticoccus tardaugens TaxID=2071624 RepID=UPI00100B9148|nr:aldehyde dehydrogenase family protein [Halegenticoccus tardaugens]
MSTDSQSSAKGKNEILNRHNDAAANVVPETVQLYIGGQWMESASGETFETRDPTTGQTLATPQAGNSTDIDRAVDAAWKVYDETWSGYSPADRQQILNTIADRVDENAEDFATLETLDNGKPISEARIDMKLVADHFRYFAGATRINEGMTLPSDDRRHVQTLREPFGVVGQIIPWNFPLLMAAWKLAPALAVGNAVVLKPAEETPLTVLKLMHEIDDVLPDGVVNVVTGFGTEAGEPLTAHEGIRKVAFTGSTEVGREVMKNAAENITNITLELGGKSPLIVYPDADLDRAVQTTITAIFFNTGECCCAGSRLFLHAEIKDEFLTKLAKAAENLTVDDPLLESTQLGPKVTEEQVTRTMDYIDEARKAGAEFVTGGERPDDEALAEGCFVTPTLIDNIDHDNRAVQEEIFGPVQEVFEWTDYNEMIDLANDVDYGLAAGVITSDLTEAHRAARDLEAGNIWINQYNDFPAGQPFGGYKQSGIGRETAFEAVEHYTQTKTINMALD